MNRNSKQSRLISSITTLIIGVVLLAGCGQPAPSSSPLGLQSPLQSPMDTPNVNSRVRFKLDIPLIEGMTRVTGQGPKGVLLHVVDITAGGEIIGRGTIGDDNRFEIKLTVPLKAGRKIGIELGTARESGTWLALWELRGENAEAIPQIGYFFDTAIVETTGVQIPHP